MASLLPRYYAVGIGVPVLGLTYIVGGITLFPLCLAVFVGFVFYTSPIVHAPVKTGTKPVDKPSEEGEEITTVYRAGWLTVRRTYEPLVGGDGTYVGMVVLGYRSFMDNRSRDPRRSKPKDRFFVVLKQNTLFLYESEEQVDCWAAVDLSAYEVVLWPEDGIDGELFVKRNAICLRLLGTTNDVLLAAQSASEESTHDMEPARRLPWFLFANVNSDKEDWYHSLVQASKLKASDSPSSLAKDRALFDPDDMSRLVDGIDQQPDSIPTRWLNAMLGRIFLSVAKTDKLESYIVSRIVRKLKRVKTPNMLSEIKVREVNMGSSSPFFSKPMLKELTVEGEASMEAHVSYVGGMRITIETVATINLGARFKPYTVRLVLAVVLKELEGTLQLKIKRPPSNRLWFGFSTMPRMVLSVEPVVSTRQIKWSMITSPIESRIREIILESIVVPHMDDICFFDTRGLAHRGGIYGDALRKDRHVDAPTTSTAADESATIGQGDIVTEELDQDPIATSSASTAREQLANTARQRPIRRRSSDGDRRPLNALTPSGSSDSIQDKSSSASTISSFSLASWRDKKSADSGDNKKKSWFSSQSRSSDRSDSIASSSLDRTSTNDSIPSSTGTADNTVIPEQNTSATRLRDLLNKRAKERELAKEKASLPADDCLDAPAATAPLSALSLSAPATSNSLHTVQASPEAIEEVEKDDYLAHTVVDENEGIDGLEPAGSPQVVIEPGQRPLVAIQTSLLSTSAPVQTSVPGSGSAIDSTPKPAISTSVDALDQNIDTSGLTHLPPPPPRRTGHHVTMSADTGASSFSSAASTTSLLASWRSKAADKQAIEKGVASAKDTMKRWGAAWNARRQANIDAENFDDDGLEKRAPVSGNVSSWDSPAVPTSPSRDGASGSYRDYRANKATYGEYFGASSKEGAGSELGRSPQSASKLERRISSASSSAGIFNPPAPLATTKLSTSPDFASGAPRVPRKDTPLSSSPPLARAYRPATMMAIPGIRDSTLRAAVASDHVSAEEVARRVGDPTTATSAQDSVMKSAGPPIPPRPHDFIANNSKSAHDSNLALEDQSDAASLKLNETAAAEKQSSRNVPADQPSQEAEQTKEPADYSKSRSQSVSPIHDMTDHLVTTSSQGDVEVHSQGVRLAKPAEDGADEAEWGLEEQMGNDAEVPIPTDVPPGELTK